MKVELSKRKLESYKRAEMVCRELRYQIASPRNWNAETLVKFLTHWMKVTGNIKYHRP